MDINRRWFKYNGWQAAIGQLVLTVIAGELHEWGIRSKATVFGDMSASEKERREGRGGRESGNLVEEGGEDGGREEW